MDFPLTESIVEAVQAGDSLSLMLTVLFTIPVIFWGCLRFYESFSGVRRSNRDEQRARFDRLLSALKMEISAIADLQLEEAFRSYYGRAGSAAEVRSLTKRSYPSQAIRDYIFSKKYLKYKETLNGKGVFKRKEQAHRYRIPILAAKISLSQTLRLAAYVVFVSAACLVFSVVLQNNGRLLAQPYDGILALLVGVSLFLIGISSMVDAAKYKFAEQFITEYGRSIKDNKETAVS